VNKSISLLIVTAAVLTLLNVHSAQGCNSAIESSDKEMVYLTVLIKIEHGKYKYIVGQSSTYKVSMIYSMLEVETKNILSNAKIALIVDAHSSTKVILEALSVLNKHGYCNIIMYSYEQDISEKGVYYVNQVFIEGDYKYTRDVKQIYSYSTGIIPDISTCYCE